MEGMIQELIDIIEGEANIYETLLGYSKRKQGVILENDIDTLSLITLEEERLINDLIQMEEKREGIIKRLSTIYGVPPEELNLRRLKELLPSPIRDEVTQKGERLRSVVEVLSMINHRNSRLISERVAFTNKVLDVIMDEKSVVYEERGLRKGKERSILVDKRA